MSLTDEVGGSILVGSPTLDIACASDTYFSSSSSHSIYGETHVVVVVDSTYATEAIADVDVVLNLAQGCKDSSTSLC